ncbi:MAG: diguanylate cyclase [Comamonadaceae bacterium]|nr:diguanylate cyclase [Comamonadaceae bacterium]
MDRPSAANRRPTRPTLRLEQALQLLAQSGHDAAARRAAAASAWLQGLIDALVRPVQPRRAHRAWPTAARFELALARELDRVARSGEPALLLVLDIDHFKRVNDTLRPRRRRPGASRPWPRALLDSVRPMDLVARIGGEEFAIVAAQLRRSAFGQTVAERVRRRIERTPVAIGAAQQIARHASASAAPSRRSGCARRRRCGSSAPTSSSTAPRPQGRNRVQLEPAAVSVVSAEEKRLLFDTVQFQDHE